MTSKNEQDIINKEVVIVYNSVNHDSLIAAAFICFNIQDFWSKSGLRDNSVPFTGITMVDIRDTVPRNKDAIYIWVGAGDIYSLVEASTHNGHNSVTLNDNSRETINAIHNNSYCLHEIQSVMTGIPMQPKKTLIWQSYVLLQGLIGVDTESTAYWLSLHSVGFWTMNKGFTGTDSSSLCFKDLVAELADSSSVDLWKYYAAIDWAYLIASGSYIGVNDFIRARDGMESKTNFYSRMKASSNPNKIGWTILNGRQVRHVTAVIPEVHFMLRMTILNSQGFQHTSAGNNGLVIYSPFAIKPDLLGSGSKFINLGFDPTNTINEVVVKSSAFLLAEEEELHS